MSCQSANGSSPMYGGHGPVVVITSLSRDKLRAVGCGNISVGGARMAVICFHTSCHGARSVVDGAVRKTGIGLGLLPPRQCHRLRPSRDKQRKQKAAPTVGVERNLHSNVGQRTKRKGQITRPMRSTPVRISEFQGRPCRSGKWAPRVPERGPPGCRWAHCWGPAF
ncbi:hypothetical protein ACOMHN_017873 [Nucella lapillus]